MARIAIGLLALLMTQTLLAAEITDETISQSRDWQAQLLANDLFWQKPACVASTLAEDGQSSLEVIAFFDAELKRFTEPMIHVITPFDVTFFEVEVTADNISSVSFSLLPVALPQNMLDGVTMVGARALYGEREDLIQLLRRRNRVNARYLDSQGEVKNIRFSLRGSSNTLSALFSRCELQFQDDILEQLTEIPKQD